MRFALFAGQTRSYLVGAGLPRDKANAIPNPIPGAAPW
ncbi:hypothetical protein PS652_05233 [Pseudomonas fluorescens]|uniref:Uncharacterized protein n=1 Tax=Pseudomonas fluorescens TaxID=294 RepID=A0A5E6SY54_PSEFL|nr:hypothetical protein PS652_02527 [Pseudomonas fluorescens]